MSPRSRRGRVRRLLRGSDLALAYAALVLAVGVWLLTLPAPRRAAVVLECSTDLANLRHHPARVIALSAVVVQGWPDLLLLVPLVIVVTAATRWLGRAATLVALVFGHVFATLCVAALLVAGIHAHLVDPSVSRAPDVGTSYALAGTAGVLTGRLRGRRRTAYLLGAAALLAVLLTADPDFTEVGHAFAFVIGAALTVVALAGARAARAADEAVRPPPGPSPAAPAPPRRPGGARGA